jgi:hypothetical protein
MQTVLKWKPAKDAAKWTEGTTVAIVTMRNGVPDWRTFGISRWHRPDWCDRKHENYDKHHASQHFAQLRDSGA